MKEEKVFFTNSRGETLSGVLHHPSPGICRGAVIVCHGMESNKDSEKLLDLGRALAQRSIMALRFDFSYVGDSSGRFENITYSGEVEDLRAAYSLVKSRNPGKIAILGSSMGGTVALMFAAGEPGLAALVTVAAPFHPEQFPRRVLTPQELAQWRARGFTYYNGHRINLSLLEDLERINVSDAARKIVCPVLILHGDQDEVVPVAEAHELYACLTNSKRLSILPATDHRLSDPKVMQRAIAEALEWLTEHVA